MAGILRGFFAGILRGIPAGIFPSGSAVPATALRDRNGDPILDRGGNYLETRI